MVGWKAFQLPNAQMRGPKQNRRQNKNVAADVLPVRLFDRHRRWKVVRWFKPHGQARTRLNSAFDGLHAMNTNRPFSSLAATLDPCLLGITV